MTLAEKIGENRRRWARWEKYERMLIRLDLRAYEYEDEGKSEKANRIIRRIKIMRERGYGTDRRRAMTHKIWSDGGVIGHVIDGTIFFRNKGLDR